MPDFVQQLALQIPRLRRYARALTHNTAWADDLVQDTLERALRRRWLFRLNSNLTAWLFTILYRLYLNDVARARTVSITADAGAQAEQIDPAQTNDVALQIDMQRALASLSTEHRAVIVLIGLEQLSYKETSDVLGIPIGTVMSRLARARDQLRLHLSDKPTGGSRSVASAHLTRVK